MATSSFSGPLADWPMTIVPLAGTTSDDAMVCVGPPKSIVHPLRFNAVPVLFLTSNHSPVVAMAAFGWYITSVMPIAPAATNGDGVYDAFR